MRLPVAIALILLSATPALSGVLKVPLDQSARVSLARPARDIVVSNPAVADVTLLDARNVVVLGKSYGTTSLLIVDAAGRTIVDHQIVVSSPDTGTISLYRGVEIQTFACDTRCERSATSDGGAPSKAVTP